SAVLVEAGRVLLPGPFFASAILVPLMLDAAGAGDAASMPGAAEIVAGNRVATVALWERPPAFPVPPVPARLRDGRVTGVKHFVPDADIADDLLVLARDPAGELALAWTQAAG